MKRDPNDYRAMFRAMVWRMVLVSVLPIVGVGTASFVAFYSLNRTIALDQHAASLRYHRESIEGFLKNVTAELFTLAHQYSLEELRAGNLERVFEVIQQQAGVFTDVGIIDSGGNHVRYVGPYDLRGKNYRDADWFREVAARGSHVSDVFLGHRRVPHFVVAVKRQEGDDFWILRATVSTDYFGKLVDAGRIGQTGETFVVNSEGLLQSKTREGPGLLAPSDFPDLTPHDDIRVRELEQGGRSYVYTTTWLANPTWMLVFRQDKAEMFGPLRSASVWGAVSMLLGSIGATALALVLARRQVRMIRQADAETDALNRRLLMTGKAAAVGEMSAGLAHEINNPLATIDTLQTWISDLAGTAPISEGDREEILDSAAKIGQQVHRCKAITQGLLKFSRRVDAKPQDIDIDTMLSELATITRARARLEGVELETELGEVPPIWATPVHVQQIFVNLVNNAIDATAGRADARVVIRSRLEGDSVVVEVEDNGNGIAPEDLSRIFLPFFTTKPVGKGTGLGLAITYGIVQELGGSVHVESALGRGTTFIVSMPQRCAPPAARSRPGGAEGQPATDASSPVHKHQPESGKGPRDGPGAP